MYVAFERHRKWFSLELWCLHSSDYDISPIFIAINGLYYLVHYIWYIAFIESYYFLCVKKTIEHICRNMCLLICKFFVMAYLSVQNILCYY